MSTTTSGTERLGPRRSRALGPLAVTLLLCLLAAPDPSAWAQPRIDSVVIHCDLPRCRREAEVERLLRLTELSPQQPYRPQDGDAAVYFLERTGFFENVTLSAIPTGEEGVDVVIDTQGRLFIRNVDIDSGLSLESEIEERIFMRSGEAFNPEEIEPQVQAIIELFEDDGYYDTDVRIEAVDVQPYLVDLEVTVERGERLDIRQIYLKGHDVLSYQQIRSIILDEFGFFRTFTADAFDEALDAVIHVYRSRGYYRARILTREFVPHVDKGVVDLYVELREGSRWEFAFTGNRHFTESELTDELPFMETGYIDDEEIAASARDLEALYRTAGYYFASVQPEHLRTGPEGDLVEYVIYEGPQAEIRRIDFEGNANVTRDELMNQMATREYGVFESGGYLQSEQMEADIRAVEAYYHELGYLGAYVPRWTLVAEDEGESLFVTIFVHEGIQTQVRDVRFEGAHILSTPELTQAVQLESGQPLSPRALQNDLNAILELYSRRGYRPRETLPTCITDEGESLPYCPLPSIPEACRISGPQSCHDRSRGDRTLVECSRIAPGVGCEMTGGLMSQGVTLEYRLDEGELVTVGEIFVSGNYQTRESIIRREFLLRENTEFDYTLLLEGQSNLRSLGLFNSVSVRTIGIQAEERYRRNHAAIIISVEEKTSQFVEFRVGLMSQNTIDNQFRLVLGTEATYADQNFLGRAEELRIGGAFQFEVTGVERVAEGEFIVSAGIVYLDPRFYWLDLASEPWEGQIALAYLYDLVSLPQNRMEYSLTLQTRREFRSVRGLAVNLDADFKLQQTRTLPEQEQFEQRLILELSPAISIDRRDNPINPRRGFWAELAVNLADDFIAIDTEEYTRFRLRGSAFLPLLRHFVLGTHLRFGFTLGGILSLFDTPEDSSLPTEDRLILPPGERFRLGGVSGLRGFQDNSLGPLTASGLPLFGDVVLNAVAELRYPLVPDANLYGAFFLEAGQLAADFTDIAWEEFRSSAGLGVRWLAFGLVPVVLDYGLVLDRRVGEEIGQFYLNVGYTF